MKATVNIPAAEYPSLLVVNRKDGKIVPRDVERVKQHLSEGGSMIATPWGALDHEASRFASLDRAKQNACNYVQYAGATLLPVRINQARYVDRTLPVKKVVVEFGLPILPIKGQPDKTTIGETVEHLYPNQVVWLSP